MISKIKKAVKNPKLVGNWVRRKYAILPYFLIPNGYTPVKCRRIGISVNSKCNLRCVMCDIGQRRNDLEYSKTTRGEDLSLDVFKRLIDDVKNFKPVIAINGTEPLLYKELIPAIRYILDNKLRCELTTNGYLLEKFAREFVEIGLPQISISIDGSPEVHNRIRGVSDSFERAWKGIQKIIEMKRELNKSLPKISVAFTISNYNAHCLNETAKIFKNLEVNSIGFYHLNFINENMARSHNNSFGYICKISPSSIAVLNPEDIDEFVLAEEIKKVKNNYPADFIHFSPDITTSEEIRVYYSHPEIFIGKKRCFDPWMNAQVLSNGDVVPGARCFHIVLGNIYVNKFSAIWNSAVCRKFRKEFRNVGGVTPACSRCCGIFN